MALQVVEVASEEILGRSQACVVADSQQKGRLGVDREAAALNPQDRALFRLLVDSARSEPDAAQTRRSPAKANVRPTTPIRIVQRNIISHQFLCMWSLFNEGP